MTITEQLAEALRETVRKLERDNVAARVGYDYATKARAALAAWDATKQPTVGDAPMGTQ